jgi:hypothetical protein
VNRKDKPIYPRLGAAVDFLVRDEDMAEVARWIMANLPYEMLPYPIRRVPRSIVQMRFRQVRLRYGKSASNQLWENSRSISVVCRNL